MIKTANLTANTETSISGLGGAHCRINNNTAGTLYASAKGGISAGGDDVTAIPAGRGDYVVGTQGTVYLLSSSGGSVQVEGTDILNRPFDNAAVSGGVAVGNPVIMDGLQGGVPFSEIVVSGKNLLKYPYVSATMTKYGITFTDNGDGSITVSGTHDGGNERPYFGFYPWWADSYGRFFLKKGQTVTLYSNDIPNGYTLLLSPKKDNGETITNVDSAILSKNPIVYTATQDCYIACGIMGDQLSISQTVNFTCRPQLELGDTATAYEPPITGHELTIQSCGKNLIPPDYMTKSGTYNGVTVNVKSDGRFDISGTATKGFTLVSFIENMSLVGGKKYTFSCNKQYDINTFNCNAVIRAKDGTWKYGVKSYPCTIIASDGDYISSFGIWANEGVEISAENVEIQMEIGDTATEYETPVGSTTTITPDSNPYTVPDDIRQQDGLNTVSVSAGELTVEGVYKNHAIKKIWDKLDELTTAIIVSTADITE